MTLTTTTILSKINDITRRPSVSLLLTYQVTHLCVTVCVWSLCVVSGLPRGNMTAFYIYTILCWTRMMNFTSGAHTD